MVFFLKGLMRKAWRVFFLPFKKDDKMIYKVQWFVQGHVVVNMINEAQFQVTCVV